MGWERYVIEAIFREGRSHREVAAANGVSKAWVTKLVARDRAGGELALEPRSRRPKSCAHATAPELQDAVLTLRRELDAAGRPQQLQRLSDAVSLRCACRHVRIAALLDGRPDAAARPRSVESA
jgi:transposase